jgi:ubiquinone/menaquinone biosynthesis C-methylase UbiE
MTNERELGASQSPISSQSNAFLEVEGDRWFERNQTALDSEPSHFGTDTIKRVLQKSNFIINDILEIGCGNGAKLNNLCNYFEGNGSGIDPSAAAIANGNELYKDLNLSVATASDLPYDNDYFDLVYFGFCLYLLDRNDVLKAVAECDRVLKTGGFLAILDFDPKQRSKNPYHHKPGLFTYKNSYSDFFTAGGHYYLVAKESFSHESRHFDLNSNERVSLCILYKEPETY